MPKWIKIKDRLPKEWEEVLVWDNQWNKEYSPCISNWRMFGEHIGWRGCKPTHWMPLPKPPRKALTSKKTRV